MLRRRPFVRPNRWCCPCCERGHPLAERDLPVEVRKAHTLGYDSKDRTEGMRQAMLHYRAVLERMVGPADRTVSDDERRREMA